jgi:hypothetical protein
MQTKTFRLFISSTFSDFNEERRLLQTYVFPEIRSYCSNLRGYTFQPIDLRWGVSNEAQLDQKTLELCIDEVHASKLQPYPNFLIMAGDRYGWVPLTYAIERNEFETILGKVYDEDKGVVNQWYKLDENQIPPSYILQERRGKYEQYSNWEKAENQLRNIIQKAVNESDLSDEIKYTYFESATEQETVDGILNYKGLTKFQELELSGSNEDIKLIDKSNIYSYIRTIDKDKSSSECASSFIVDDEDRAKANEFKDKIKDSIDIDNILEVKASIGNFSKVGEDDEVDSGKSKTRGLNYEYKAIGSKDNVESEKQSIFVTTMTAFLKSSIDSFHDSYKEQNATKLDEQIESQKLFRQTKSKGFVGREDDLQAIQDYISGDSDKYNNEQALVIYGPSGMGKSALMAKAIEQTEDNHKDKKVIYRFVGSKADLSTSIELVLSILGELGIEESIKIKKDASGDEKPESILQFFDRISEHLSKIQENTFIFIDAVDQFTNKDLLYKQDKYSDEDEELGDEFKWLPSKLPSNLKVIISALKDEKYEEDSKYIEVLKENAEINEINFHQLKPFDNTSKDASAKRMADSILAKYNRTITAQQQKYLFKQTDSNQPLYLSVASQELKHWKSSDKTKAYQAQGDGQDLAPTQREIIDEYIRNLTDIYHHDEDLVYRVFSYLHLCNGLSETELLDILSADDEFLEEIAPSTYHVNTTQKLPVVIWARLHSHIKPFLKLEDKNGQEVMSFFHREFDAATGYPDKSHTINDVDYKKLLNTHKQLISLIIKLMQKYQNHSYKAYRYGHIYINLTHSYLAKLEEIRGVKAVAAVLLSKKHRKKTQKHNQDNKKLLKSLVESAATIENQDYLLGIYTQSVEMARSVRDNSEQAEEHETRLRILSFFTEALFNKYPDIWVENHLEVLEFYVFSSYFDSTLRKGRRLPIYKKICSIKENLYKSDVDTWAESYLKSIRSVSRYEYESYLAKDERIRFLEKAIEIEKSLLERNPRGWAERHADSLYSISLSYGHKQKERKLNAIKEAIEVCEKYKDVIIVSSVNDESYNFVYNKYKKALRDYKDDELWSSGYRAWIINFARLLTVGAFFWLLYSIFD